MRQLSVVYGDFSMHEVNDMQPVDLIGHGNTRFRCFCNNRLTYYFLKD